MNESYPWYGLADGDGLEQGDLLLDCPTFRPTAEFMSLSRRLLPPSSHRACESSRRTENTWLKRLPDSLCGSDFLLTCHRSRDNHFWNRLQLKNRLERNHEAIFFGMHLQGRQMVDGSG